MTQAQATHIDQDVPADAPALAGPAQLPALGGLILALSAALILIGVMVVFSASARLDRPLLPDQPFKSTALRQGLFALLGLTVMWITYGVGYRCLRWRSSTRKMTTTREISNDSSPIRFQPPIVLITLVILCLVATLIPGLGVERHGARRWLHFGPVQYGIGFQPSEFAKIGVIVFLAAWLAHRQPQMKKFWRGIMPPVAIVGIVAALIVPEDLGTAALIVLVAGMMILTAGACWWHAILLSLPGLAAFVALTLATPYRLERVMSFRDIWADPLGSGYHAIQSLVAIASGGWWGRGLGAGMQKYGYLPEAYTDFVFAIICEELGLFGAFAVMAMFLCLIVLGWAVMTQATDRYGQLLALGITLLFGFQAAMNVAVVTVSIPTKGISLPLISAGGSGVVFYAVALALLASVSRTSVRQRPRAEQ